MTEWELSCCSKISACVHKWVRFMGRGDSWNCCHSAFFFFGIDMRCVLRYSFDGWEEVWGGNGCDHGDHNNDYKNQSHLKIYVTDQRMEWRKRHQTWRENWLHGRLLVLFMECLDTIKPKWLPTFRLQLYLDFAGAYSGWILFATRYQRWNYVKCRFQRRCVDKSFVWDIIYSFGKNIINDWKKYNNRLSNA